MYNMCQQCSLHIYDTKIPIHNGPNGNQSAFTCTTDHICAAARRSARGRAGTPSATRPAPGTRPPAPAAGSCCATSWAWRGVSGWDLWSSTHPDPVTPSNVNDGIDTSRTRNVAKESPYYERETRRMPRRWHAEEGVWRPIRSVDRWEWDCWIRLCPMHCPCVGKKIDK